MCFETISDKAVVTRKRNSCAWCGERIEAKVPAHTHTYRGEDTMRTDHFHPECWNACTAVVIAERECIYFNPGDYARGGTDPIT